MKKLNLFNLSLIAMLMLTWGCMENALTFDVRFPAIAGLKQADPVYFERNEIGRVDKITYTAEGDYLVQLTVLPEFRNAATIDSRFFIGSAPTEPYGKAVLVVQEKPGGAVIAKGAVVQGSVAPWSLDEIIGIFKGQAELAGSEMRQALQQLKESLEDTSRKLDTQLETSLADLSHRLQRFNEEVQKVPDSREVQELEKSIRRFSEEFDRAQQDVRDHIRRDVLPQLRRELDQLRERLEGQGREQELEQIDKQFGAMNRA